MKMLLRIFVLMSFSLLSDLQSKPYMEIIRELDTQVLSEVCQEKGYSLNMIGGGAVEAISQLNFGFDVPEEADISIAREVYLDIFDTVFELVNSNQKARPFFIKYPMDHENFDIRVNFSERREDDVVFVFLMHGNILYKVNDSTKPNGYRTLHKETLEEARRELKAQWASRP